jgi:hypothetical protein
VTLQLTKSPGFEGDLFALPSRALMERALTLLVEVARGNLTGQELEKLVATGDLSDCRKIYFDVDNNQKPRYRLVYRLTPDEVRAVAVEAVAVGERRSLDAYVRAAKNLGRLPNDE